MPINLVDAIFERQPGPYQIQIKDVRISTYDEETE